MGCVDCDAQGASNISIHDNIIGDGLSLGKLRAQSAGDAMELYAKRDDARRGLSQVNNVSISHNTFIRAIRGLAAFGADAVGQMHNWTMQDNIFPFGNYGVGPIGNSRGCDQGIPWGSNDFRRLLSACVTNWKVDHNAVFNWQGGSWPPGNSTYKNPGQLKFNNYQTGDSGFNPGNYALTSASPMHNAASDRRDLGANVEELVSKIASVRE
jgi:hypothetical protein